MRGRLLLPALLLALAACQSKPESAASPAAEPVATAEGNAIAAEPSEEAAAAAPRKVSEETELYRFDYFYPAAAAAIGSLKERLDNDLASERSRLLSQAREDRDAARKEGYDYTPHARGIAWQVVTELPAWLSLSAEIYSFSGGAHPNRGFDALLWDKQAGVAREVADLFTSRAALSDALRPDFCRELDRQRDRKRGGEGALDEGSEFNDCIDPLESTVILGSSTRQAFDRIGVLIAPYAAGPYVEGSYEVTLPITAEIRALVKPAYREAFAADR